MKSNLCCSPALDFELKLMRISKVSNHPGLRATWVCSFFYEGLWEHKEVKKSETEKKRWAEENKASAGVMNKGGWSLALKVSAQRAEASASADHGVSGGGRRWGKPWNQSAFKDCQRDESAPLLPWASPHSFGPAWEGSSAAGGGLGFLVKGPRSLLAGWTDTKSPAVFHNIWNEDEHKSWNIYIIWGSTRLFWKLTADMRPQDDIYSVCVCVTGSGVCVCE